MTGRSSKVLGGLAAVVLVAGAGTVFVSGLGPEEPERGSALEAAAPSERITVQVLNAGGVDGLARKATAQLRDAGFDVVEYGDAASWDRDSTWVVDRVGRLEAAYAVAEALGVGNVQTELDSDLFVDVTVQLGRHWTPGGPTREVEVTSEQLPWWNPRRWLHR